MAASKTLQPVENEVAAQPEPSGFRWYMIPTGRPSHAAFVFQQAVWGYPMHWTPKAHPSKVIRSRRLWIGAGNRIHPKSSGSESGER